MPLALRLAQTLILTAFPHGGQHTARRNAWAGMASDAARARERHEADAALSLARAVHAPGDRRSAPGR